jgi:hypothetical protein
MRLEGRVALVSGAGGGIAAYVDLETGESSCVRLRGRPLSVNFVRGDTLLWLSWNERRGWGPADLEMTRTDGTVIDGFNRGDRYPGGRLANAAMRKGTDVLLVRSEYSSRKAYVAAVDVFSGRHVEATEEDAEALASADTFDPPWRFLGERHQGKPPLTVRLSIEDRVDAPSMADTAKEVAAAGAPITRIPDDETWGIVTAAEGELSFLGALEREAGAYALFAHLGAQGGDALLVLDIDANGNLKETMRVAGTSGDGGLSAAGYAIANGYLYRIWEGMGVEGRRAYVDRLALSGAGENRRIALGGIEPFEADTLRIVPAADGGCFILIPRYRDGHPSVCRLDAGGGLSWAKTLIFEPTEGELGAPLVAGLLADGIAIRHHDTVITLSADGETVARRRYPSIDIPGNLYYHRSEGPKLSVVAFEPQASRATILRLGEEKAVTRFVLSPDLASAGLERDIGADYDAPPRLADYLLDGGARSADPLRFFYVKDRAIRARLEENGAYFIRNAEDHFLAFCTTTDALPSVARQSVLVKRWAIGAGDFFGSVSARYSFDDGDRSEELPIALAEADSTRAVATNEGELTLERNYRGVTMRAFDPPAYAKERTK